LFFILFFKRWHRRAPTVVIYWSTVIFEGYRGKNNPNWLDLPAAILLAADKPRSCSRVIHILKYDFQFKKFRNFNKHENHKVWPIRYGRVSLSGRAYPVYAFKTSSFINSRRLRVIYKYINYRYRRYLRGQISIGVVSFRTIFRYKR